DVAGYSRPTCPLVARLGPPGTSAFPPLVRAKRTSVGEYERSRLMSSRPGLQLQQPRFDTALALDLDRAARLEDELVLELVVDRPCHLDHVRQAAGLHTL